jgi:hypothetical protein
MVLKYSDLMNSDIFSIGLLHTYNSSILYFRKRDGMVSKSVGMNSN